MKKAMAIFALLLVGCVKPNPGEKLQGVSGFLGYVETVTVDSCRYVLFHDHRGGGIVHAGNCPNHATSPADR